MNYWIARDQDGELYLYDNEPNWEPDVLCFMPNGCSWEVPKSFARIGRGDKRKVKLTIEVIK